MKITKKHHWILLGIWILFVPPIFYIANQYFPAREIDWLNVSFLFGILFITMLMPLRLSSVSISLERWITFTIFLQYGVFAELIFMQLATVILLFSGKSELTLLYRFLVNSTLFALVSIVSGFVFHAVGGTIGSLHFTEVFTFALIYAITYTLCNNVLLKIYFYLNSRSYSLLTEGALWDYITTIIMLPFSISLYFLNEHLANKSILLLGIPFTIVLLVIIQYKKSDTLHEKLTSAGDIGHELADRLHFDEVMQTFIYKLKDVVPFENAYVVDLVSRKQLVPLISYEDNTISKKVRGVIITGNKNINDGLDSRYSKIFSNYRDTLTVENIRFNHPIESMMTAPIKRNFRTEGFLILTSSKRNSFQMVEMKIIDLLTGYFAISLEKSRFFERTVEKSERCGLTKLYNFRYLELKLGEDYAQLLMGEIETLSVLTIDIDHFKKVNDTYGHESGNDLLIALADLLCEYVKPSYTLARFGGEEFVFLLPNVESDQAAELAEKIRSEVEHKVFTIIPDLSESRTPTDVKMTISVGVASAPGDAEDVKGLLRNADRALYIGGKQAGRNRVGVYERLQNVAEQLETPSI